nr:hypothetical protein CFP56_41451 [Quercus suber]
MPSQDFLKDLELTTPIAMMNHTRKRYHSETCLPYYQQLANFVPPVSLQSRLERQGKHSTYRHFDAAKPATGKDHGHKNVLTTDANTMKCSRDNAGASADGVSDLERFGYSRNTSEDFSRPHECKTRSDADG